MSLASELRTALSRYLAGDLMIDDVYDWLTDHVAEEVANPEPEARRLMDHVWFLIDGYAERMATEEELRRELQSLVISPVTWQAYIRTLQAFVDEDLDLDALRDWLAVRVQAIADSADEQLTSTDHQVWILLSEYDLGDRNLASVRHEIAGLLPTQHRQWQWPRMAPTVRLYSGADTRLVSLHGELLRA